MLGPQANPVPDLRKRQRVQLPIPVQHFRNEYDPDRVMTAQNHLVDILAGVPQIAQVPVVQFYDDEPEIAQYEEEPAQVPVVIEGSVPVVWPSGIPVSPIKRRSMI